MRDIMDVSVGNCCYILDNQRIPLSDDVRQKIKGDIPYYGANGIVDYINDYLFNEELILLAEDGGDFENYKNKPIAYKIQGKSWVNNHAHILKAKKEYCQNYIFYCLEHKNILHFILGGTRTKLNKSSLINIEIQIPKSKKEQEKIAEILSEVDSAIEHAQALHVKHQKIKTALMQDLLTHGIAPNGKIRNPKTHAYKPSPLGDIPVEWDVKYFNNTVEIIDGDRGINYPTQDDFFEDEFCIFLNAKNVTKLGFNFKEKDFITKEKDKKLNKGKLNKLDCVLTTRGTVGNVAFFDDKINYKELRINSGMVILRNKVDNLIYGFFYIFLQSQYFDTQVKNVVFGSAQPQLTVAQIKKFIIKFPKDIAEQQKIAQILSSHDEKIEKVKTKLEKLQQLKTALMQDLLSGTKRVNHLLGEEQ